MPLKTSRSSETMVPQTVNANVLVLLIEDDPAAIETIREALAHREGWCRLQSVGSVSTGMARVAGGDVSVVLMDLSKPPDIGSEGLKNFHQLHDDAPGVPIVVICGAEQENLALSAVRAGAADYIIKDRCVADLERVMHSVVERDRRQLGATHPKPSVTPKAGKLITLLGAKGGVGTTTVALNVASVLAHGNKAIVAELRSTFGTLSQFIWPQMRTRNITGLLNMDTEAIAELQADSCLWPYKTVPGLSLLFGPETMEPCQELTESKAKAIVAMLSGLADFIVLDLPAALSKANRAVIEASDVLALVIENDPICVQAASMILRVIELWKDAPQIGAIIVSRAPLSSSVSIGELESQLRIPILGVIPPAADLCRAAQNAHLPLVTFDPESLIAGSFAALAEKLAAPANGPVAVWSPT